MEMKNFTIAELYCSVEFTGEVHGELVFLSVINTFLSITAFLGNTLILVALHKDTSIHPPSKILYRNLAITDLCVGIIAEPIQVAYWLSVVNRRWNICYYTYLTACFLSVTLCSVSLIERFSFECRKVIGFALSTRCDWLKRFAPPFHPIRSKTKANCDALACIFPRFASATCNYFEF